MGDSLRERAERGEYLTADDFFADGVQYEPVGETQPKEEVGTEFWVSAADGRDHSAEIQNGPYGYGDIVIQWLTPGESGYQRVRLSQEQMDDLCERWRAYRQE